MHKVLPVLYLKYHYRKNIFQNKKNVLTNVGLVFSISSFFINKTAQANKSAHENNYILV